MRQRPIFLRLPWLALVAVAAAATACLTSPPRASTWLTADDFVRQCAVDADCAVVTEGDQCDCCGGGTPVAINGRQVNAYQNAAAALRSDCRSVAAACFCPALPDARCADGWCTTCSTPGCKPLGDAGKD